MAKARSLAPRAKPALIASVSHHFRWQYWKAGKIKGGNQCLNLLPKPTFLLPARQQAFAKQAEAPINNTYGHCAANLFGLSANEVSNGTSTTTKAKPICHVRQRDNPCCFFLRQASSRKLARSNGTGWQRWRWLVGSGWCLRGGLTFQCLKALGKEVKLRRQVDVGLLRLVVVEHHLFVSDLGDSTC